MSLRILHVLDHSWPVLDGYAQRSRSIVMAQATIGMRPTVLTGPLHQTDDPDAKDVTVDGVRHLRTLAGSSILASAIRKRWPLIREVGVSCLLARRIAALVEQEEFDVIHAHSPALCGEGVLLGTRNRRVPFVYEIRSFWEEISRSRRRPLLARLRSRLGGALESHVVRRADAVVGIAQAILQDLEKRNVSSSKLFHVPNGVDVARFAPRVRDAGLAGRLGVNGVPTLGFVGTFFPWEGVPWLVHAAAALKRQGVRFKLIIVGDGADAEKVRQAILETASEDCIAFVGRVPHSEVDSYYSVMDVLVYPRESHRITELVTPLKPLEAMASGKAVLGSDVGGLRELINPEVTGLVFKPDDLNDFCRQALRLMNDDQLRHSLGESARMRVIAEKDWMAVVRRYEPVYETAMRNARLRS